jgi:hypothetical protein
MAARLAWVLNLDADLELAAGRGYTPAARVKQAMERHLVRLAASLLAADDVLVDDDSPPGVARGLAGRAFCPTPRALAILRRAGAEPEACPSVDVLARVNSRAFAAALGPTLPGAAFVTGVDAAEAVLAHAPEVGAAWRVKHAFGMTGRNQRVIAKGIVTEADRVFLGAGVARGGVQVEPHVAIDAEYAIHGFLAADGALRLGDLVRQRCNARGAWLATAPLDPGDAAARDVAPAMADEARRVAAALHAAGYFGPFGIDAFTYKDRGGALRLQPRSEINARYSMGFAAGFGGPGGAPPAR